MLGPFESLFRGEPEDWDQPTPPVFLFPGGEALQLWPAVRSAAHAPGAASVLHEALEEPDWRGHVFACLAVPLSLDPARFVPSLWSAVDEGSWVTPQLVALASFVDPSFEDAAWERLIARCPVAPRRRLPPPLDHTMRGPGGALHRSAKAAASLLAMLPTGDQSPLALSGARALAQHDIDRSGEIAIEWLAQLRAGLEYYGWA